MRDEEFREIERAARAGDSLALEALQSAAEPRNDDSGFVLCNVARGILREIREEGVAEEESRMVLMHFRRSNMHAAVATCGTLLVGCLALGNEVVGAGLCLMAGLTAGEVFNQAVRHREAAFWQREP